MSTIASKSIETRFKIFNWEGHEGVISSGDSVYLQAAGHHDDQFMETCGRAGAGFSVNNRATRTAQAEFKIDKWSGSGLISPGDYVSLKNVDGDEYVEVNHLPMSGCAHTPGKSDRYGIHTRPTKAAEAKFQIQRYAWDSTAVQYCKDCGRLVKAGHMCSDSAQVTGSPGVASSDACNALVVAQCPSCLFFAFEEQNGKCYMGAGSDPTCKTWTNTTKGSMATNVYKACQATEWKVAEDIMCSNDFTDVSSATTSIACKEACEASEHCRRFSFNGGIPGLCRISNSDATQGLCPAIYHEYCAPGQQWSPCMTYTSWKAPVLVKMAGSGWCSAGDNEEWKGQKFDAQGQGTTCEAKCGADPQCIGFWQYVAPSQWADGSCTMFHSGSGEFSGEGFGITYDRQSKGPASDGGSFILAPKANCECWRKM